MDQNGHCVEAFEIFVDGLQICELLKCIYVRQAATVDDSLRRRNVSLEKVTARNIIVDMFVVSSNVYILDGLVMMHM